MLNCGQHPVFFERLDGLDLLVGLDVVKRFQARALRLAVDDHGTGAAQALAASVLGTGEPEMIAQHPQQGRVVVGINLPGTSVYMNSGHGNLSVT